MDNPILGIPSSFKDHLIAQMPLLKKFARKFTSELADMDDLVQDTLLKAMTSFEKYQRGTNLKAWLYVLMKNIYINGYRKLNQKRKFSTTTNIGRFYFSTLSSHENGGERKLIITDINTALEQLKSIFNRPLELFLMGYKYDEIASTLHLPIATVKTRIFVARTQLKSILADYKFRR